jgi:hypothetical protein
VWSVDVSRAVCACICVHACLCVVHDLTCEASLCVVHECLQVTKKKQEHVACYSVVHRCLPKC